MEKISRSDAQRSGLKRYYTGRKCSKGHTCQRFTTGGECVECYLKTGKGYTAKDQAINDAKVKKYNQNYLEENREELNEYHKIYNRVWRDEHRDEYNEYHRKYRLKQKNKK